MSNASQGHGSGARLAPPDPEAGSQSLTAFKQRLMEANEAFAAARVPADLSALPRFRLAVVACMDCRLTGMIEPALGLGPGDAIVVRVAGSVLGATDDLSRSLAVAVVGLGVRTILVVGHTDCALGSLDPLDFSERMTARGVSRFALGYQSVREWLGVFSGEENGVRNTVEALRRSSLLPKDVEVAGAMLDIVTGRLTWLDV